MDMYSDLFIFSSSTKPMVIAILLVHFSEIAGQIGKIIHFMVILKYALR